MTRTAGIITFHASHNYGSMLQAYALQQTILDMGMKCEIINLRTPRQRKLYSRYIHRSWLKRLRLMLRYPWCQDMHESKYRLFEDFLSNEYILSPVEYPSLQALEADCPVYDAYISGSDQIWNTSCYDFDWSYFLPFVSGKPKIAYAPSMGPVPDKEVVDENAEKIKALLAGYDRITVRERGTAQRLESLTGNTYPLAMDPTLLLPASRWEAMAGDRPLAGEDPYIFFYTPWYRKEIYQLAKDMSVKLGLKVVVSQVSKDILRDWGNDSSFRFLAAAGPKEFLNYCRHAEMIVGGSFHLAVFSILFKVPFFTYDGMNDSRISSLLTLTGLERQSYTPGTLPDPEVLRTRPDFSSAEASIEGLRQDSLKWLRSALSAD